MWERRVLLFFAKICCICPSYDVTRKKLRHVYLWKIYQLLACGAICYLNYKGLVLPGFGNLNYYYKLTDAFEMLINITLQYIIYSTFIINQLRLILTDTNQWGDMLSNIICVEEVLMTTKISKATTPQLIVQYSFRLALLLTLLIVLITPLSAYSLPLFLSAGLQMSLTNFLLIMMDYIASSVHTNYNAMNQHITKKNNRRSSDLTARDFIQIYIKLSNVISSFNSIFGWQVVLINILAMLSSLPALHMIIKWNPDTFFIIYATWCMTLCITITKRCHNASKEGLKFVSLTFEKSQSLPLDSIDTELMDDWKQLRAVCSEFKPVFSAAGVFVIDYSVLYILFTLIMSYLAILIQFQTSVNVNNKTNK